METQQLITGFILGAIAWLLYQLIQAIFINGIFTSAQGESQELENGQMMHSEMLLNPLYRFLTQKKKKRIYFAMGFLQKEIDSLHGHLPDADVHFGEFSPEDTVLKYTSDVYPPTSLNEISGFFFIKKQVRLDIDHAARTIKFYKEIEVPRFSKYLRKPLLTCIICMASFWSIFTFLIPGIYFFGFSGWIIILWVANVFSLSYVNYLIFKSK